MNNSLKSKINDLSTLLCMPIVLILYLIPLARIISPLFTIGFAIVANNIQKGQRVRFGNFFNGFNTNPGQLILVWLVSGLLMLAPFVAVFFIRWEGVSIPVGDGFVFNWFLPASIAILYLKIAWSWASYFVVFKGLGFWSAMEASRKIITRKWFSFLGLSIVLGIILLAGILCFGVGLFIAVPFTMIVPFITFEQIVGLNDDEEIDLIDHLIVDELY